MISVLRRHVSLAIALSSFVWPCSADAQEIFGGVFRHDTPITHSGRVERGDDIQLGYRFAKIFPAVGGPRPHVMVLINTRGGTDFAEAGISWKLGSQFYVRPSFGIAVHNGEIHVSPTFRERHRIPFGSSLLFTPEISAGIRIAPHASLEATWLHFSNAGLLSSTNPGIDDVGVRLSVAY